MRTFGSTLIGEESMRVLWDTVLQCAPLGGAMVEVGVYRGGSSRLIREAAPDLDLHLCDTFAGHPTPSVHDHPNHGAGRFGDTSVEAVARLFQGVKPPVFHVGTFPASWPPFGEGTLCFVHCDVDLYQSTLDVLRVLWPSLQLGGALVCDDYGHDDCPGALRAVDEFLSGRDDVRIERLPTRQARLWKRAA